MGKKDKSAESLFTKEEEQLLSDFSRNVSTKSSALFYGSAFMVSALPICEFHQSIHVLHHDIVCNRHSFFVGRAILENSHD
jgi:hypothetical protein